MQAPRVDWPVYPRRVDYSALTKGGIGNGARLASQDPFSDSYPRAAKADEHVAVALAGAAQGALRRLATLEQRGPEEAPEHAQEADVGEEQPVIAILAGQRESRRDGIGVKVHQVVASRIAPDLLGAQTMGVLRSAADGLDPLRDRLAIVPAVVRVRCLKEGQRCGERNNRTIHPTHSL